MFMCVYHDGTQRYKVVLVFEYIFEPSAGKSESHTLPFTQSQREKKHDMSKQSSQIPQTQFQSSLSCRLSSPLSYQPNATIRPNNDRANNLNHPRVFVCARARKDSSTFLTRGGARPPVPRGLRRRVGRWRTSKVIQLGVAHIAENGADKLRLLSCRHVQSNVRSPRPRPGGNERVRAVV